MLVNGINPFFSFFATPLLGRVDLYQNLEIINNGHQIYCINKSFFKLYEDNFEKISIKTYENEFQSNQLDWMMKEEVFKIPGIRKVI